jgi:DNA primase catalytic core
MARIPNEEIERLKSEVSVQRLAEARGIELKRHGGNLIGLCPFHDDKTPSLVITPEKNLWHCMGACQSGGSVIDWVMRAHGISFRLAVEMLRADMPAIDPTPVARRGRQQGPVAKHSTTTKLPVLANESAEDAVLLREVVDYYHATLKQSPEALAYLQRRGLTNAEMIDHFKIGFANRTLGYRLPAKNRTTGAAMRGQLQQLGILRESGHEHFNGSIVIPIFDGEHRVAEMYGRKITDNLREGTPKHLYLPGPHRGVFNADALAASKEIILCEALIDALTFWCAGFRNVTASYGVEGFTDEILEAFRAHGTRRVYIAYDRDDAGERAAGKLAERLLDAGIECYRVLFPKGMDANEYALKMTPASQSLALVLRNARWMGAPAVPRQNIECSGREIDAPTLATASANVGVREIIEEEADAEPLEAQPSTESPEAFPPLVANSGSPLASPPPPATASPSSRTPPIAKDDLTYRYGDRTYRVRGFHKNAAAETLKLNVLCMRDGGGAFHIDTVELYSARQRAAYVAQAAQELGVEPGVVQRDLGELLLALETLQATRAASTDTNAPVERRTLSEAERNSALALLRDPHLLDRILDDFDRCGTVGERTNKLVGYLAATSRKLDQPLAIVIQSTSAAGKSSLMDAVLALMPEEDRIQYSAMTGQSLFYLGETDIRHKILAIVEEQGAERASYALKLLQSEGELTIASTSKDPATGRLVTQQYRVEGPVMIFLTTTAIEVDEELLNRCIVLTVDEGREQTRAIHARQRTAQTLEGILARAEKDHVVKVHRDAQRLLRPLLVVNPFAEKLAFLDHATRTRRDHPKYLTLIRTIALLHQHQREVKRVEHRGRVLEYIEATREDIAVANRLCHEVLGRSLDELPPQTRRLLEALDAMVTESCARLHMDRRDVRFTRREVRERTRWSDTQLKVHLERLVEMEYVIAYRGKQGQSYGYGLAYNGEGKDGAPFLGGLIDVSALDAETAVDATTMSTSRGSEGHFTGGGRPLVGDRSGGGRVGAAIVSQPNLPAERAVASTTGTNTHPGPTRVNGSYVAQSLLAAAISTRAE